MLNGYYTFLNLDKNVFFNSLHFTEGNVIRKKNNERNKTKENLKQNTHDVSARKKKMISI